jgi:hypothetical protein
LLSYQYSWFCERYRAWQGRLDVVMRQDHRAGEKLFVDYAGQTVPVVDRLTGEVREAQIFVAVLGASNYTYAEATWSQGLPDWIGAHQRCFRYLGGVPEIVVPDNLRSGVTKAHRYEPDANPTYQDMATHYGVAVLPARARRPRDKAKVEAGVLVVERWILAALRHRSFFSLHELNAATCPKTSSTTPPHRALSSSSIGPSPRTDRARSSSSTPARSSKKATPTPRRTRRQVRSPHSHQFLFTTRPVDRYICDAAAPGIKAHLREPKGMGMRVELVRILTRSTNFSVH